MQPLAALKRRYKTLQDFAHNHHKAFHHTHDATHLAYFFMVTTHGPYHIAACTLLILGLAFWLLRVEA